MGRRAKSISLILICIRVISVAVLVTTVVKKYERLWSRRYRQPLDLDLRRTGSRSPYSDEVYKASNVAAVYRCMNPYILVYLFISAPSTILLTSQTSMTSPFSLSFMVFRNPERTPCALLLPRFPGSGIFKAYAAWE